MKFRFRTGAIRTKIEIDYEKQNLYEFFVTAEDMGEPKLYSIAPTLVRIFVANVNDNPPQFEKSEYTTKVLLPTANGAVVINLKATDLDGLNDLKYYLINQKEKFAINESSGSLRIRNSSAFAVDQSYDVSVSVSDGVFTSTTQINVVAKFSAAHDEFRCSNDEYFVNVLENLSTRQTVLLMQTGGSDLGETVTFSLVNENKYFTLSPLTGLLETIGEPLDREEHENGRSTLIVHAHDQRNPPRLARCVVEINILDQNDCSPEFLNQPYSLTIPMETAEKTVVGKFKAVDADEGDNGRVGYKFGRLDDASNKFVDKYLKLNSTSGELTLKQNFSSDSSESYLILSIVAYDHGNFFLNLYFFNGLILFFVIFSGSPSLSTLSTIYLKTVSKGTPVFAQSSYNVSVLEGDFGVGKILLKLSAKSKNDNILGYRLVDGDDDTMFWVKFLTGKII